MHKYERGISMLFIFLCAKRKRCQNKKVGIKNRVELLRKRLKVTSDQSHALPTTAGACSTGSTLQLSSWIAVLLGGLEDEWRVRYVHVQACNWQESQVLKTPAGLMKFPQICWFR